MNTKIVETEMDFLLIIEQFSPIFVDNDINAHCGKIQTLVQKSSSQ